MCLFTFVSGFQNALQSTAFTPGLPASKDKTKEDIQAGCVNKHNDSHHIPELAAVEHSGLQVETSQKMQREVPELQGDDIVHPVIKNGTCGQEQLTKKGKKGSVCAVYHPYIVIQSIS